MFLPIWASENGVELGREIDWFRICGKRSNRGYGFLKAEKEEGLTWADDNGHGFSQHLGASDSGGGGDGGGGDDSIHEWLRGLGFRRIEEKWVWIDGA